ncbi:MAG: preprotein translocase subunit SecY [Bacteroidales bacterium]|jgi:preprotein translocase subunit SecY|nr:preprotein translocase subunit SecY [Bacteroidales bacterium]
MKRLIETIRNIFKIEELRKRILYTILIILIYRFGSFVVIPGVDPTQLSALQNSSDSGLLGLLNMFSGGAFGNASVFALGIMPYITASIIIQLLGMAVPYFQRLQKEGESGRKKLNQIMRYLTVVIVVIQAPGYIKNVLVQMPKAAVTPFDGIHDPGIFFWISTVILLVAGTLFIMWLGEKITDKGIGNGISLIIMIGIIARLPGAFVAECGARFNQGGTGLLILVIELIVLFFVMVGTIALVQGTRKIPVQYAKRVVGNRQYGGARQYIPLKVNAAGVMPIIFAQAIMFLPITIAGFSQSESLTGFAAAFTNINGFWYNLVFFLLIIAFTYFYTAVTMNTNQMAEDIKKNGGFIPGVKPGKKTAEYLDTIMSRITLPGSIFLGFVAIMPAIVASLMNVTTGFSHFYGGTSLLILVGVVLDTLQQIESHLLMHHYDGLTKTGRIKGRVGRI